MSKQVRVAWLMLFLLLAPFIASGTANAQEDNVLVGASGMTVIQLDTWATGEIPPIEEGQQLRLSRLHFDACTGVVLHNNSGSALIYAESTGVNYAFQGGESYPRDLLAQGDAVPADPTAFLTIINANADPAFAVDLLILSVVEEDSFVDVPMIETFEFPDDSGCDGINPEGLVTPAILGEGTASAGGDTLYIGSAIFQPGSTTEGWGLINRGSAFNFVLSAGGMGVAGPNSGRAAYIGPGGVLGDEYLGEDTQIQSFPFVNNGSTPVFGLVFGTVTSPGAVWLPVE